MEHIVSDFNGADRFFGDEGSLEWLEVVAAISAMPVFLQPSDQAQKVGEPIFDPKATNSFLHESLTARVASGWRKVPVPAELQAFGLDWDGGKGRVLAEWQFSNYPFLWNNVIRSEAMFKSCRPVGHLRSVGALIVVTKCGLFPASNSTLYYEQARAQLEAVTSFQAFSIPIRLVGLSIQTGRPAIPVKWTVYPGRYSREGTTTVDRLARLNWKRRTRFKYDCASFELD